MLHFSRPAQGLFAAISHLIEVYPASRAVIVTIHLRGDMDRSGMFQPRRSIAFLTHGVRGLGSNPGTPPATSIGTR
jgi:hypothetical protein